MTAPFVRKEHFPNVGGNILGYATNDRIVGQTLQADDAAGKMASYRAYPYYQLDIAMARRWQPLRVLDMERCMLRGRDKMEAEEALHTYEQIGKMSLHPALAAWAALEGGSLTTYAGDYNYLLIDEESINAQVTAERAEGLRMFPWTAEDLLCAVDDAGRAIAERTAGRDDGLPFRYWRELTTLTAMHEASLLYQRMGYKAPYSISVAADQSKAHVAVTDGERVSLDPIGVATGLIASVPETCHEVRAMDVRYVQDLNVGPYPSEAVRSLGGQTEYWTSIYPVFTEAHLTAPLTDVEYVALPAYADMGGNLPASLAYVDDITGPRVADGKDVIEPNRPRSESVRVARFYNAHLPLNIPSACRPRFAAPLARPEGSFLRLPSFMEAYFLQHEPSETNEMVIKGYVDSVRALAPAFDRAYETRNNHAYLIAREPSFYPRYVVKSAAEGRVFLIDPDSAIIVRAFAQDGQAIISLAQAAGGITYDSVRSMIAEPGPNGGAV